QKGARRGDLPDGPARRRCRAGPAEGNSGVRDVDHGALEALDHPDVRGGAGCECGGDLLVAVEVPTAVRVELGDGGLVIGELEAMHAPTAAVVTGIARRSCGDVRLQAEELVDRVEARVRPTGVRQIRRRIDGAVELTVHVEGWAGHGA